MVRRHVSRVRLNERKLKGELGERSAPRMPHQKLRGNVLFVLFVFLDRITAGDAGPAAVGSGWERGGEEGPCARSGVLVESKIHVTWTGSRRGSFESISSSGVGRAEHNEWT